MRRRVPWTSRQLAMACFIHCPARRYIYRSMHTPFFPLWRRNLARGGRRFVQHRQQSAVEIEAQFGRFLAPQTLARPPCGPASRTRVFFLSRVFWCFLWQVLQPRTPCRAVLRQIQASCETADQHIDESTSAYCQARARLPRACVDAALRQSAAAAERVCPDGIPGWTRPVRVADATCIRLPDTPRNRAVYPYAGCQRPGCGFPYMKILALFSLASGAILELAQGVWKVSEVRLLLGLKKSLRAGDILLGDRAFGSFFILASLPRMGVDVVSRLNRRRCFAPGRARRLGPSEWNHRCRTQFPSGHAPGTQRPQGPPTPGPAAGDPRCRPGASPTRQGRAPRRQTTPKTPPTPHQASATLP